MYVQTIILVHRKKRCADKSCLYAQLLFAISVDFLGIHSCHNTLVLIRFGVAFGFPTQLQHFSQYPLTQRFPQTSQKVSSSECITSTPSFSINSLFAYKSIHVNTTDKATPCMIGGLGDLGEADTQGVRGLSVRRRALTTSACGTHSTANLRPATRTAGGQR